MAAALLFLSGFSALVYQVLWTRELGLFFGHTIYAVSAVLTAFMGGLALGSHAGGRLMTRVQRPLAAYGWLELGIGAAGFLFWLGLPLLDPLYRVLYESTSGRFYLFNAARVAMATGILLIPASLMGATLPAVSAWSCDPSPAWPRGKSRSGRRGATSAFADTSYARRPPLAASVGLLYAANTLGATTGALAAGFLLIERLGVVETQVFAAVVNAVVGVVAIGAARRRPAAQSVLPERTDAASAGPAARTDHPHADRRLLVVMALSGFTALAYEVIWTRGLVFYVGTTTHAFTSMLSVYLAGLAAGSFVAARLADRLRNPSHALVLLQLAIGASCGVSLTALRFAAPAIDTLVPPDASWLSLLVSSVLKSMATMLLPTLLFGATFPVALRLMAASQPAAALVGRLYAANTWGALGGAITAGFVLIPLMGIRGALVACGLLNVALAVTVGGGLRSPAASATPAAPVGDRARPQPRLRWAATCAAVALVGVGAIRAGAYLHRTAGSERLEYYAEGNTATISVVREVSGTKTLYIDKVPVAATDPIMLTDQKTLAHLPMLLHPDPRRVLTVGFGSGGASWSFARYDRLEGVDCVEIDPAVFGAAPHLHESNHGVWHDPRFRLIIEDARSYLAYAKQQYDIISTDCTDLRYKSNASLYTTDYFGLCRRRLKPDGMVVVWMPLGGLDEHMFKMALRTFRNVFPHATLWYLSNYPTHYALLIGTMAPLGIDANRVIERLAERDVHEDLAEIGLERPAKILSGLLLDEVAYAEYVGEGPVNSDRYPLLEFMAPRRAYRFALSENLAALARRYRPVAPRVVLPATASSELRASMQRAAAAVPALLAGHVIYQRATFDHDAALTEYRRAAAHDPSDASIPVLIDSIKRTQDVWMREHEARVAAGAATLDDRLTLARLFSGAGRYPEAITLLRSAVAADTGHAEARRALAAALARAGDEDAALAEYDRALALAPHSAEAHNDLGLLLLARGDLTRATASFEAAAAADPASAAAFHNLGLAHAAKGDAAAAERGYRDALARDPRLVEAWGNLAALLAATNRRSEAIAALESLLRIDPTVDVARRMLAELQ